jgi:hypothetical protein
MLFLFTAKMYTLCHLLLRFFGLGRRIVRIGTNAVSNKDFAELRKRFSAN